MIADRNKYLLPIVEELNKVWPNNRTVNIVCHGHSVPAGYASNNVVQAFDAYPHLLWQMLCKKFPCAVINVIISAIGGEGATQGSKRFEHDVLSHHPDLVTIDYALNDRFNCIEEVEAAWRNMIEAALAKQVKVLLLTPTIDCGQIYYDINSLKSDLTSLSQMIRDLADEYSVGLVDSYAVMNSKLEQGYLPSDFLSSVNHPNRAGHEIVAREIMRWFPILT